MNRFDNGIGTINGTVNGTVDHASPRRTDRLHRVGFDEQLALKLETGNAVIGVVGLGYVGLPLAVEYAERGFSTIGFELNETRVDKLNRGVNYIDDVDDNIVRSIVAEDRFAATSSFECSDEVDVFFICVPTPVTVHKEPDTGYIESAAKAIAKHLRPGQLIILKSTTYPNTTEGVVQPILEEAASKQGMMLGQDYFLAFSPERIDPGNKQFTTANTPVVVGGVKEACTSVAELALRQIVAEVHTVSNPKVAEMEKLLENIFRSVNIALVNELARLCDRIGGISMWEVVQAAATKPFGFMPFYPGPGLGGHCIPIDPHYLSWLARKYDFETSFITLSARINEEMPFYVTDTIVRAVANQPIRLEDARILVLGVAFKRNVDDTRHAPAETVIRLLRDEGVRHIHYCDPHVESYSVQTSRNGRVEVPSVALTEENLASYDVAVILTDHDAFDYEMIARHARSVVDTRNALADVEGRRDHILLLGGGN